mmetsp:Transcript_100121/g.188573  ORF Transcript_100121/g.188573 Transcript_100121/m.188573 type:complete len:89 (+) Transcript_100121:1024-1290(+)
MSRKKRHTARKDMVKFASTEAMGPCSDRIRNGRSGTPTIPVHKSARFRCRFKNTDVCMEYAKYAHRTRNARPTVNVTVTSTSAGKCPR